MASSRQRTRGDMCSVTIETEDSYGGGVASSSGAVTGGWVRSLTDGDGSETEELPGACGSRISGGISVISRSCAPSMTVRLPSGSGLLKAWLERVLGGTSPQQALPSSAYMVKVGPSEWHIWTGGTVGSLTVTGSELGAPVEVEASITAIEHAISSAVKSGADTAVTVNGKAYKLRPASVPSAPYVRTTAVWSVDGTPVSDMRSWSLKIDAHLSTVAAMSADGTVALSAGGSATPQESEVTLSLTVPSTGSKWAAERPASGTHTLALTIDGCTITLTGCVLGGSGPSRTWEGAYDETLEWTAQTIALS